MGNLIVLRRRQSALTVSLRQRFITPLAVGRPYVCVARLAGDGDGQRLCRASAEVLDEDGTVCATAAASYQPLSLADAKTLFALSEQEITALASALAENGSGP
jgi:acyl-coenzyme A thioesterase PaaI-like protein